MATWQTYISQKNYLSTLKSSINLEFRFLSQIHGWPHYPLVSHLGAWCPILINCVRRTRMPPLSTIVPMKDCVKVEIAIYIKGNSSEWQKLKSDNFDNFPHLLDRSANKYPGAQQLMLTNIPIKFHDSSSSTFGATCTTSWKSTILTKSGAVTLLLLDELAIKLPGAQQLLLTKTPIKF